jgi:predicted secreted protein
MSLFGGVVTFIVVWWVVLFTVLPFGIQSQVESHIPIIKGTEAGAPQKPNLKFKFLVSTAIALCVWGSFFFLFYNNILSIDALIK